MFQFWKETLLCKASVYVPLPSHITLCTENIIGWSIHLAIEMMFDKSAFLIIYLVFTKEITNWKKYSVITSSNYNVKHLLFTKMYYVLIKRCILKSRANRMEQPWYRFDTRYISAKKIRWTGDENKRKGNNNNFYYYYVVFTGSSTYQRGA